MTDLLQDKTTYTVARKAPFRKVERELNALIADLKNQEKLPDKTYRKLHSSDAIPPSTKGSIKHHKVNHPLSPIVASIDLPYTTLPNFFRKFFLLYKTRIVFQ